MNISGIIRKSEANRIAENVLLWMASPVGLVFILWMATFIRLFNIGHQSIWLDESLTLGQTKPYDAIQERLSYLLQQDSQLPAYYALLWLFFQVAPYTIASAQLLSVSLGVWSVYGVYRLAADWQGKSFAFMAGLLCALQFFHIHYSQEIRFYPLVLVASVFSFRYFFLSFKKSSWHNLILWSVFSLLLVLSYYYGIYLICIQAVIFIWVYFAYMDNSTKRDFNKLLWIGAIPFITFGFILAKAKVVSSIIARTSDVIVEPPSWHIFPEFWAAFYGISLNLNWQSISLYTHWVPIGQFLIFMAGVTVIIFISNRTKNYSTSSDKDFYTSGNGLAKLNIERLVGIGVLLWFIGGWLLPFIQAGVTGFWHFWVRYVIYIIPALPIILAASTLLWSRSIWRLSTFFIITCLSIANIFYFPGFFYRGTKDGIENLVEVLRHRTDNYPIVSNAAHVFNEVLILKQEHEAYVYDFDLNSNTLLDTVEGLWNVEFNYYQTRNTAFIERLNRDFYLTSEIARFNNITARQYVRKALSPKVSSLYTPQHPVKSAMPLNAYGVVRGYVDVLKPEGNDIMSVSGWGELQQCCERLSPSHELVLFNDSVAYRFRTYHHHRLELSSLREIGFRGLIDVSRLPRGQYRVGFIVTDPLTGISGFSGAAHSREIELPSKL